MTQPAARPERCILVIDPALPPGLAANAAAVLALTLGARHPQLPGPDVVDTDAAAHPGLIPMGLPVLAAPAERLPALRRAALDVDLLVVDLPTTGQQTTDYATLTAGVAGTPTDHLRYLGLALCGPARAVRRITGGLPLLR